MLLQHCEANDFQNYLQNSLHNILFMSADQLFLLKVLSHKKTCLVILLLGNINNLFQNLIIATFLSTRLGVRPVSPDTAAFGAKLCTPRNTRSALFCILSILEKSHTSAV